MSSLAAEDVATLRKIGRDTIMNIVALCVEAVLYTIYGVLVVMAGRIMLRRGRSNISTFLWIIILLMFLLDTAMCIIDVNNAVREITYTLMSTSSASLADRYKLTNNLPYPVEGALYAFMSNLGDIIIIWRVHAFWSHEGERWVLLIPIAFLLGSLVTSGLISFCVAELVKNPAAGDFVNPPFCKNVQLSSYVTTLATTAVATLLIAYKTWHYRRTIGLHLRSSSKKTRVEKVMAILVESGALYFLFFLEAVITDTGNIGQLEDSTPQLAFASTVWTYMTSHILGIYPVLVVILVHKQWSYIDASSSTIFSGQLPISTMQYTHSMDTRGWTSRNTHRSNAIEINVHEMRSMKRGPGSESEVVDECAESSSVKESTDNSMTGLAV